MVSTERKYFLFANLGPEISRYLTFVHKFPAQAQNSKKRIQEIFEEIYVLNEDKNFARELENLYDFVFRFNLLDKNDIEIFFRPIILRSGLFSK